MINKNYLKLLACPQCLSKLSSKNNRIVCSKCIQNYQIINDIPILIKQKLEDDLQLTQSKWDVEYDHADLSFDIQNLPYLRDSYKHIKKYMPKNKGRFLELGCGTAKNSLLLAKNTDYEVYGIDISLKAIQQAKALFLKEKTKSFFVCGDIRNLPFKDNCFDYMYAGGTIEHFRNTKAAVSDLYRCIKKNGVLTATVPFISLATPYWIRYGNIPNINGLKQILEFFHTKIARGKMQPFGYETSFTENQLISLFKDVGFRDVEFGLMETYYEIKIIKNPLLKNFFRKLAQSRLFWPFVYINGKK